MHNIAAFLITYLGLLMDAHFKEKANWDLIVEKFERRLSRWKSTYITKVGKLTFTKSVLSRIPSYYLSPTPLTFLVDNKLETI